jgi:hypothetical protein
MYKKFKTKEIAEQKLKEWQEKAHQEIKDRGDEVLRDDSRVVYKGVGEYIILHLIYTKQMVEDLKNFEYIDIQEEEMKILNNIKD